MKQLKLPLTFSLILFLHTNLFSQECSVLLDALKGKYEGDCEKGKAHGKGKATGMDSYDGEFKSGYPDGKGSYIWKDGHYFIGQFKKGKKEGSGNMYYEAANGQDSIISGFWKKDVYAGAYEKPYEILSTTSKVNKINCRITEKGRDNIIFTVSRLTDVPVAVSDIQVIKGTFYNNNTQKMGNQSMTTLNRVTFPFQAIITYTSGDRTEILFNEKADYDVTVDVL